MFSGDALPRPLWQQAAAVDRWPRLSPAHGHAKVVERNCKNETLASKSARSIERRPVSASEWNRLDDLLETGRRRVFSERSFNFNCAICSSASETHLDDDHDEESSTPNATNEPKVGRSVPNRWP